MGGPMEDMTVGLKVNQTIMEMAVSTWMTMENGLMVTVMAAGLSFANKQTVSAIVVSVISETVIKLMLLLSYF